MLITRIKSHDSLRFTLPDGTTFTVKIEIEHLGAAKTITDAPREIKVERVHFISEGRRSDFLTEDAEGRN